ncbi:unnamed protein product [Protopolystoma xenopodis]|uniref:Uncharacterized protein n=1 Tax=Protopolystoma xenopodis TaxID=117903 RepID=A0A3S4ZU30_9PLAT|nr:unnamed protein product [Protopolystoma xenopodis]
MRAILWHSWYRLRSDRVTRQTPVGHIIFGLVECCVRTYCHGHDWATSRRAFWSSRGLFHINFCCVLVSVFLTRESYSIVEYVTNWKKRTSKISEKLVQDGPGIQSDVRRQRFFKATVMDASCDEVLISRYLTPLNPPDGFLPTEENGFTLDEAMVSLYIFDA